MTDVGDPGSRPNPIQASTATNGILIPPQVWEDVKEALTAADSILSLLHYRGAAVTDGRNEVRGKLSGIDAEDVEATMNKVLALTRGSAHSRPRLDCAVRSAMFLPQ